MKQDLERYLNDHLAGATGALCVIQQLIECLEESEEREFFIQLKAEVQADRELLEKLLESLGLDTSGILKAAGGLTGRLGLLKLMWEGLEAGELGRFEALEMLALGVQGKHLLWLALSLIAEGYPEWIQHDFPLLGRKAVVQREGIERWRLHAARETLSPEVRS